jgi:AAA+ superfamily predicted ATPase
MIDDPTTATASASGSTTAYPAGPGFLSRVRLRAQQRVLWMRHLWRNGLVGTGDGVAITHGEVDRILAGPERWSAAEAEFFTTDEAAQAFAASIRSADAQARCDPHWQHLCRKFSLSVWESDLLALVVSAELDPWLRRVFGYLHDDATACYPSLWLAAALFEWPAPVAVGPGSSLVRWHLARPVDGSANPWAINVAWQADPHIVLWTVQGPCADPALGDAVELAASILYRRQDCFYPTQLDAIQRFVHALGGPRHSGSRVDAGPPGNLPPSLEIELVGPDGAGKRTLAGQLAASLELDLVVADARSLVGPGVPLPVARERLVRTARLARLAGALIYWQNADMVDPGIWLESSHAPLSVFGVLAPMTLPACPHAARLSWRLPPLQRAERIALWQRLSDQPVPAPVASWALTPGEIAAAARVAPAGMDTAVQVCQQMAHRSPGELFTPVPCPFSWDDIILAPQLRQHLEELEQQARLRWQVYEEWDLGLLSPLGKGISALFAGPSGTGKTMAAQVLARVLGLELYRVDLSGVMNKYIGETEKRLKQVFDACERANVLLFFDEADALFGQRTQVKDAHDRFANIEIDYLLQRMEQFDGLAILATNRKSDLDRAFLRRLRFIIEFVPPGPADRLAIWRRALPSRTPQGEELLEAIDWEFLAAKLTMTGADIKATALAAAFLARAQGTRISMRHILHAARRELAKHGVVVRPGDWEEWDNG